MGDITDKSFTKTTAAITLTSASEGTLLSVTRGVSLAFRGGQTIVKGWANIVLNTSATGVETRLYRGTTTSGTEMAVASAGILMAAGSGGFDVCIEGTEQLGDADNVSYTMTMTPVTTGSGGSVRQSALEIEIVN